MHEIGENHGSDRGSAVVSRCDLVIADSWDHIPGSHKQDRHHYKDLPEDPADKRNSAIHGDCQSIKGRKFKGP